MITNRIRSVFLMAMCAIVLPSTTLAARSANSNLPVEVTADSLSVIQKDSIARFTGNVLAKQGDVSIRSDEMIVYYRNTPNAETGAEKGSVSKIDVNGNVLLSTTQETAKGTKGFYNIDDRIVKLTGDVLLTRGKNVLRGDDLTYNVETGNAEIHNTQTKDSPKKHRVTGVFVPESDKKTKR